MTLETIGEHSDNIEPEAGCMLIAEGNAFTRRGIDPA